MNRTKTILLSTIALLAVSCGGGEKTFTRDGATISLFSVAPDRQVRFSRGNLQYQASTGIWRFAEKQYDIIGEDNKYIDSTYDGWIDLFGYGTSIDPWFHGFASFACGYNLYGTDTIYGDDSMDPTEIVDWSQYDWGVVNKIKNGGDKKGLWRTLKAEEWRYLLRDRESAGLKWGLATIDGIHTGIIIMPDDWQLTGTWISNDIETTVKALDNADGDWRQAAIWSSEGGFYFKAGGSDLGWETNTYTLEQWDDLERHGAIFLPAAGIRSETDVRNVAEEGRYWTADEEDEHYAYTFYFNETLSHGDIHQYCFGDIEMILPRFEGYIGLPVRLVMDEK